MCQNLFKLLDLGMNDAKNKEEADSSSRLRKWDQAMTIEVCDIETLDSG
jgi:hypothetical protein